MQIKISDSLINITSASTSTRQKAVSDAGVSMKRGFPR